MVGPSWAPLAQMRPWLAGALSTPRTRVTCAAVPSRRSRQPTPQYGQIVSPSSAMRDPLSTDAARTTDEEQPAAVRARTHGPTRERKVGWSPPKERSRPRWGEAKGVPKRAGQRAGREAVATSRLSAAGRGAKD